MHFSSNLLFVATNPLVASSSLDTYFPVADVVSSKLGNLNRIKLLFQYGCHIGLWWWSSGQRAGYSDYPSSNPAVDNSFILKFV